MTSFMKFFLFIHMIAIFILIINIFKKYFIRYKRLRFLKIINNDI